MGIEDSFGSLQKPKEPIEEVDSIKSVQESDVRSVYQKKKSEFFATIKKYEVAMTDEQINLLKMAAKDVADVLREYGVFINTKDILSYIYIVMPTFNKEVNYDTDADGGYESHFGAITLKWRPYETQSMLAMKAVHEILHYYQFDNRKKGKGEESLDKESLGMMMESGDNILFLNMLESVTQKLTIEVMGRNKDARVTQEYEWLKKDFKKDPAEGFFLGIDKPRGHIIPHRPVQVYEEQIQKFDRMLLEIYEKNKDQFKNVDEVFKVFVDVAYSGRKLPMARLIEKTYGTQSEMYKKIRKFFGKKSAFRDIAKKWSK